MNKAGPPPQLHWLPALREPGSAAGWSQAQWQQAVRLARRLRLLGRLAESIDREGLMAQVPLPAQRHLVAEQRLSRWRTGVVVWALQRVGAVLADRPYPRVLLKGGAYLGQDLDIARGRLPSDLDILVPHEHIDDALSRLRDAGWDEQALDEHDRIYYRDWSHEVPPLHHPVHPVELDLHHNILPPVARTHVDAGLLLERLMPSRWPAWQVFSPVDQLLHSAAHLFLDAEPRDRVRDLVDLDGLCRHFGAHDPSFWPQLPERAAELGLSEPLAQASHFLRHWFATPMPDETRLRIERQGPSALRRAWLNPLMRSVLTPADPDRLPPWTQDVAATIVLARYHRQRLPLRLLVPHLWHKWRTDRTGPATAPETPPAI